MGSRVHKVLLTSYPWLTEEVAGSWQVSQMTPWVSKWLQCTQIPVLPEKWQFIQKECLLRRFNPSWFLGPFALVSIVLHYFLRLLSARKAYLTLWWPCSLKVACSLGKKFVLWFLNCTLRWQADGDIERSHIWHKLVSPISCLSRKSLSSSACGSWHMPCMVRLLPRNRTNRIDTDVQKRRYIIGIG